MERDSRWWNTLPLKYQWGKDAVKHALGDGRRKNSEASQRRFQGRVAFAQHVTQTGPTARGGGRDVGARRTKRKMDRTHDGRERDTEGGRETGQGTRTKGEGLRKSRDGQGIEKEESITKGKTRR